MAKIKEKMKNAAKTVGAVTFATLLGISGVIPGLGPKTSFAETLYKARQNAIVEHVAQNKKPKAPSYTVENPVVSKRKASFEMASNDIPTQDEVTVTTDKQSNKNNACQAKDVKVAVIALNKVRQMIVRSSSAAYNFFCKRSTPFSKVLPTMIVKKVKPSEFKDLTQFNEKDDAILPNGMPMGLRMWSDVAILNVTKQQQLKQAEKGVKGLEKLEKYFEEGADVCNMSMDLGKANWYKRAALQTKKQIDKLKAYIAKLKQLIKEGKTNVKEDPPAIIGFSVVKQRVAVVGNWLIEIDPVRGITMFQIKQTAKVVANGGSVEVPYTQQQLRELMESDTFYMGLGSGYVTSDGVGVLEAANGQPMGYVITKEMIGRLFNIDFNSLSLNERVQKIYELIQNGDISFGIVRGKNVLNVKIGDADFMCSTITQKNSSNFTYFSNINNVGAMEVVDTQRGKAYLMLVDKTLKTDDKTGKKYYGLVALSLAIPNDVLAQQIADLQEPRGISYTSACDVCHADKVDQRYAVDYE